jgi:hypothetical protein
MQRFVDSQSYFLFDCKIRHAKMRIQKVHENVLNADKLKKCRKILQDAEKNQKF